MNSGNISTILFLISNLLIISGCTSVCYKVGCADCAPVYGNWCGENYPLPESDNDPYPVDAWDDACRDHDMCYRSGESKRYCDNEFIQELERLSYQRLAPQAMHNAHSYFKKDGQLFGWFNFSTELEGALMSCEGGDGRAAEFYCNSYGGVCRLDPWSGPGRAGMPCHCGGFPGVIFERCYHWLRALLGLAPADFINL